MIVQGSTFSVVDGIKLGAIIISILVLIVCAVIYYRLSREWKNKYEGRAVVPGKKAKYMQYTVCLQVKHSKIQ